jgi:ParB family transcriptional regulator, chromosome partitioning protein
MTSATSSLDARTLPLAELYPLEGQPRIELGPEDELQELAESIRTYGLIEPILVTPSTTLHSVEHRGWTIIAGHRRVAACRLAELDEVPAIVRYVEAEDLFELSFQENLHRRQLSPVEEALAFAHVMKARDLNQTELGKIVHRSPSHVSRRLQILKLPQLVIRQVHEGTLTMDEALGVGKYRTASGRPRDPRGRKTLHEIQGHSHCSGAKCEIAWLRQNHDMVQLLRERLAG